MDNPFTPNIVIDKDLADYPPPKKPMWAKTAQRFPFLTGNNS